MNELASAITMLLGGGAIGVIVTALVNKKKVDADAENTNIQSILEIDSRMNDRLIRLEERVAMLEKENFDVKRENMHLKHALEKAGIVYKDDDE